MKSAPQPGKSPPAPSRRLGRALGLWSLGAALAFCALLGGLVGGMLFGPVELALPGGSALKLGTDDFVLSNYVFQNGTTYFVDFHAQGVRGILEFQHLKEFGRLEIVFNGATRDSRHSHKLVSFSVP